MPILVAMAVPQDRWGFGTHAIFQKSCAQAGGAAAFLDKSHISIEILQGAPVARPAVHVP